MLPKQLKIPSEENSSILIHKEVCPHFEDPCHFHSDLELNLILKGTGMRIIGDNLDSFRENDLVLLGPGLPHHWKSDPSYFTNQNPQAAQAIIKERCMSKKVGAWLDGVF